jgi:aryl carrier-like protein
MAKIQETVTVTIDEQSYEVAALSDGAKQMIAMMDEWRQKEADVTSDLLMARAAIRDIQNTLLATIKAEVAPAEVAPEAPAGEAAANEVAPAAAV